MYNDTNSPGPDETKPNCYPAEAAEVGSHRKYTVLRTVLRGENSVLPQENTCSQAISALALVSRLAFHDQGQHQAYCLGTTRPAESMSAEAAAGNWGRCENTADSSSH